jgi:hypothetical protein
MDGKQGIERVLHMENVSRTSSTSKLMHFGRES